MQPAQIVSLKQLRSKKYATVLCYPEYSSKETIRRIQELKQLGVKAIEFTGEKTAFNLPVLGKGYVGIVVVAHTRTDRVALKIRRVDADRKNMQHEAEMIKKANSLGIGPKFVGVAEDFLLMEYVQGALLPKWLTNMKGRNTKTRIRRVLHDILEQCRKLDEAGLDHGELSHAPKHIIIDTEDEVHLIDFETASTLRQTSNVTSIVQYLFLRSQLAAKVRKKLGKIDDEAVITTLRNYKQNPKKENFTRVTKACRLA